VSVYVFDSQYSFGFHIKNTRSETLNPLTEPPFGSTHTPKQPLKHTFTHSHTHCGCNASLRTKPKQRDIEERGRGCEIKEKKRTADERDEGRINGA